MDSPIKNENSKLNESSFETANNSTFLSQKISALKIRNSTTPKPPFIEIVVNLSYSPGVEPNPKSCHTFKLIKDEQYD